MGSLREVNYKVKMSAPVQGQVCPFCGLCTDVPHETQRGCIDALHAEIARMRDLLDAVRPVSAELSTDNPRPALEDGHAESGPDLS